MNINLTKLTRQELKNLLANNQKTGNVSTVNAVILEMSRRGAATRRDYRSLRWNQETVRDAMQPFKNVADAVFGNRRKSYTEAGGRKIGRASSDPDKVWIDTYSAIKTSVINAVLVCYIKRPGDDPEFQLIIDRMCVESYTADRLTDALSKWQAIASKAIAKE